MIQNRAKRIVREGGLALASYASSMGGIPMVEIIGHAGFDAVFIDMEHTAFDLHEVQVMILAAERVGITPVVRPPGFDPGLVLRLLDMGAQGIQLPHIDGAEAARAAVRAVRFPPLGERGMIAHGRVSDYGKIPALQHIEQSNNEVMLTVMVEDLRAVEEIDAIASTEGVDLVSVGPSDLARSLGAIGEPDSPRLAQTIEHIAEAVKKSGNARLVLPLGHAAFPCDLARLKKLGVGYTTCGPSPQVRLLRALTQQVTELRREMANL